MFKRLEDGRIIDERSGELVTEQVVYVREGESLKIIKAKDDSKIPWGNDRHFVKLFLDRMPKMALKLSGGSLAIAIRLTEYINYDTGMITKSNGGHPLTNIDVQEIIGYSNKTINKFMTELVDNKVLFRGKTGNSYQYYANPYLFVRGGTINKTLVAMFKNYSDKNVE